MGYPGRLTRHRLLLWPFLVLTMITASTRPQEAHDPPPEKMPAVEGQIFDHNGGGVQDVEVSLWPKSISRDAAPIAVVRTNQYGDFQILHEPPLSGAYVVVFNKKGYAEVRREIEIVPGEFPPFVDLSLPGGLTATGSVIDKLKGTPVAGAQVRVTVRGRNWNVTSDEHGTFRVEGMIPGQGLVTVDADGFGRAKVRFAAIKESQPLGIELSPERVVDLEIVDLDGAPVAGVTIECLDEALGDYRSLVSDEKGAAVLHGMGLETTGLLFRLTHPAFVADAGFDREVTLPADKVRSLHRLTLLSAGRVVGRIVDLQTGRPLQGVRVTVSGEAHPNVPRDWTGFDGAYAVSGVPPGEMIVTVYLNGYAPQLKSVTVRAKEKTAADFALAVSGQATGLVVDQEGKPIPEVYIYATSWRGHSTLGTQALTGDDGRFVLHNIPDDEFEVTIEGAGYQPLTAQLISPGKKDHRFELTSRSLPPGLSAKLKIGGAFPELEMVTLDGKSLKMSDLKGKTVLIDFWATWCGPCVAEIPNLVLAYDALGSRKDFEIIGISLDADQDEKKLRKFIADKKMTWTQVFGEKGGAEEAAQRCGVEYIPQTFLVGPDGLLKATDLAGPSLKNDLAEILNVKPVQR